MKVKELVNLLKQVNQELLVVAKVRVPEEDEEGEIDFYESLYSISTIFKSPEAVFLRTQPFSDSLQEVIPEVDFDIPKKVKLPKRPKFDISFKEIDLPKKHKKGGD